MLHKLFQKIARLHGNGKTTNEVCREWHCFWIGFSESFCFFIKSRFEPTAMARKEMRREWHYYRSGMVFGIVAWVVIVISTIRMFL